MFKCQWADILHVFFNSMIIHKEILRFPKTHYRDTNCTYRTGKLNRAH